MELEELHCGHTLYAPAENRVLLIHNTGSHCLRDTLYKDFRSLVFKYDMRRSWFRHGLVALTPRDSTETRSCNAYTLFSLEKV